MVSIRFARFGTHKKPYYHFVVTHSENPRDGKFLEQIGTYDPSLPLSTVKLDKVRFDHWVGVGAQPSTRVRHVVNQLARVAAKA
jgi:small subunit ribosomal protein S16